MPNTQAPRFTHQARETLALYEIAAAEWLRYCGNPDRCGCMDDRCMDGFHHEPGEECHCLPVWVGEYVRAGRPERRSIIALRFP